MIYELLRRLREVKIAIGKRNRNGGTGVMEGKTERGDRNKMNGYFGK